MWFLMMDPQHHPEFEEQTFIGPFVEEDDMILHANNTIPNGMYYTKQLEVLPEPLLLPEEHATMIVDILLAKGKKAKPILMGEPMYIGDGINTNYMNDL